MSPVRLPYPGPSNASSADNTGGLLKLNLTGPGIIGTVISLWGLRANKYPPLLVNDDPGAYEPPLVPCVGPLVRRQSTATILYVECGNFCSSSKTER